MTTAIVVDRALVIERTKDLDVKGLRAFRKALGEVLKVETEAAKASRNTTRYLKAQAKEQKAAERKAKKEKQIAELLARLDRLQNPVGYAKMKAAKKPGPVKITKC